MLREEAVAIRGSHVTTIGRFCGAKFDGGFVSDPFTGRQTQANIILIFLLPTSLNITEFNYLLFISIHFKTKLK